MSDHQNLGNFGYDVLLHIIPTTSGFPVESEVLVDFLQSVRLLGLVECFGL
jgi:hypothetical protein